LTTLVNAIREAEDIVAAAEARGYRPQSARRVGRSWQSGDVLLALGLVASGAAILLR
jgi:energy-coupling factor transporter transmembrane protein EcfT